jgi:hypothetical protein
MFSVRFRYFANSRVDQCERPVLSGGVIRVSAITRDRTRAGTCSRAPPGRSPSRPARPCYIRRHVPAVHQLPQLGGLFHGPSSTVGEHAAVADLLADLRRWA